MFLKGAFDEFALARLSEEFAFGVSHPSPKAGNFYPEENATFFEDTSQRLLPIVRFIGLDAMVAALWDVDDLWCLGGKNGL